VVIVWFFFVVANHHNITQYEPANSAEAIQGFTSLMENNIKQSRYINI